VSCAKTAETIDLSFVDSGGPKEAQVQSYSPSSANVPLWEGTLTGVLVGRHIGTTWRIRLNRPSVEAMQPYVKLL